MTTKNSSKTLTTESFPPIFKPFSIQRNLHLVHISFPIIFHKCLWTIFNTEATLLNHVPPASYSPKVHIQLNCLTTMQTKLHACNPLKSMCFCDPVPCTSRWTSPDACCKINFPLDETYIEISFKPLDPSPREELNLLNYVILIPPSILENRWIPTVPNYPHICTPQIFPSIIHSTRLTNQHMLPKVLFCHVR